VSAHSQDSFLACCSLSPFPLWSSAVDAAFPFSPISLLPLLLSLSPSLCHILQPQHSPAPAPSIWAPTSIVEVANRGSLQRVRTASVPTVPLPGTGGRAPKGTPFCLPREGSGRSWTRWGPARGRKEHKIRLRRSWSKIVVGCTESTGLLGVVVLCVPCLRGDGP
jgi:hypothetical protein